MSSKLLYLVLFSTALAVCGCTYSVNQVQTKGTASDVVDETQETSPTISPTIDVPIQSAGSGISIPAK